jgi:general secretion pathway protein L
MQTVLVYLQHDGSVTVSPQINLEDIAANSSLYRVTVIVPGQDVLCLQTKIPKMSPHKLLQVVPFALEDQLLTDVNELHFAIGPALADNHWPVFVVAKKTMQAWLSQLAALNLQPACLLPETLAIPLTAGCWQVQLIADQAIVRTGPYSGFATDRQNLNELLALNLNADANQPAQIIIHNYTSQAADFTTETVEVIEKTYPSTTALTELFPSADINLLQGLFQPKASKKNHKKIGLRCLAAALVMIALLFTLHLISFAMLTHDFNNLEQQINSLYKKHFPNAKSVIAPKERMLTKLTQLTQQSTKNRLLLWFAYLGKSLSEITGIQITQLDFQNNQLNLQIIASNSDTLDRFTESLKQQGLSIKQQDVAVAGTNVKGTLIMTEKH